MSVEEKLQDEFVTVLNKIAGIPRKREREKILWQAMHEIANVLGVRIREEK